MGGKSCIGSRPSGANASTQHASAMKCCEARHAYFVNVLAFDMKKAGSNLNGKYTIFQEPKQRGVCEDDGIADNKVLE